MHGESSMRHEGATLHRLRRMKALAELRSKPAAYLTCAANAFLQHIAAWTEQNRAKQVRKRFDAPLLAKARGGKASAYRVAII